MSDLIPLDDFIKAMDASGATDSLKSTMENRQFQFDNVIPYINKEFGIALRLYTSACPVQVMGDIDGYEVYFRSRWDTASLQIGGDENPIFHTTWEEDGEYDASWLPPEKVGQYLFSGLSEYRKQSKEGED